MRTELNIIAKVPGFTPTQRIWARANTVAHDTGYPNAGRNDRKTCIKLVYPTANI